MRRTGFFFVRPGFPAVQQVYAAHRCKPMAPLLSRHHLNLRTNSFVRAGGLPDDFQEVFSRRGQTKGVMLGDRPPSTAAEQA